MYSKIVFMLLFASLALCNHVPNQLRPLTSSLNQAPRIDRSVALFKRDAVSPQTLAGVDPNTPQGSSMWKTGLIYSVGILGGIGSIVLGAKVALGVGAAGLGAVAILGPAVFIAIGAIILVAITIKIVLDVKKSGAAITGKPRAAMSSKKYHTAYPRLSSVLRAIGGRGTASELPKKSIVVNEVPNERETTEHSKTPSIKLDSNDAKGHAPPAFKKTLSAGRPFGGNLLDTSFGSETASTSGTKPDFSGSKGNL
ncbi:hypothetical protein SeMB42_g01729 [Synchytrium endobioticum]|uniref:Uncharacterized protein n=1 Tax=Synchytrium endobioticum TaxID=286115 RepID=A0A507DJS0_9FUNG|nr:hypothetical protein SeMB42_g01729 [Synchytrium endobioticum]